MTEHRVQPEYTQASLVLCPGQVHTEPREGAGDWPTQAKSDSKWGLSDLEDRCLLE